MNTPLLIGIGGVAGAGKDTFYYYFKNYFKKQGISVKRYSFGDELKKEVNSWTTAHYGVNALECSREEKEVIRPFLISHGVIKRKQTNGEYWINKLTDTIANDKEEIDIACITDVRYNNHRKDEVGWLKEKGGLLIYVSRLISEEGVPKPLSPQNSEEMMNDPAVREGADYVVEIKNSEPEKIPEVLEEKIKEVLKWIMENGGSKWRPLLIPS